MKYIDYYSYICKLITTGKSMKYFIIAGEASGDLHGAELIKAISAIDPEAQYRFLGGDLMAAAAGTQPLVHYREMAHMGFIDVARHLRPILGFLRTARDTVEQWHPHAVVLIDYPSFNLKVAKRAHELGIPTFYFISPKVWVWKEWRVKAIKRDIDTMCCILPFEPDFYRKHDYEATYVGNPTVAEISRAKTQMASRESFCQTHGLAPQKSIIALVPGSRIKEIRDNLPTMLDAAFRHPDCQLAVAAAPGIDRSLYDTIIGDKQVQVIDNDTWTLVYHSKVALVTSGTATLETTLLGTPQVACYRMGGSKWLYRFYRRLLKGDYVTLPNLIANKPIIPELLLHNCSADNIDRHLTELLGDTPQRQQQLDGYASIKHTLGTNIAAETTAQTIFGTITSKNENH